MLVVTDVSDDVVFADDQLPGQSIEENSLQTVQFPAASGGVPGAIFTYALTTTLDANPVNDLFAISGQRTLAFKVRPDYEEPKAGVVTTAAQAEQNRYTVTVSATDQKGNTKTALFTVTVADVQEGPLKFRNARNKADVNKDNAEYPEDTAL